MKKNKKIGWIVGFGSDFEFKFWVLEEKFDYGGKNLSLDNFELIFELI